MNRLSAILMRAFKTLIQAAIGSAASAALAAISTAQSMGEVNWYMVASTACLAAIVSMLMNLEAELPEVGATVFRDEDDRSDDAPVLEDPEEQEGE